MINLLFQNPLEFVIVAGMLVLALSVHEFFHAYIADHLGDPTPKIKGRILLNPLAHLDPVGTMLILFVGFGWGKPVPIDPFNFRNPKKDTAVVSAAGPFSNLCMAILASLFLRFTVFIPSIYFSSMIQEIIYTFMYFNIVLAVFNLIPIYPLDGFSVVAGLLPKKYYHEWLTLERYGYIFLIFMIFPFFGSSPVSAILSPIVNFILNILIPAKIGGII